MSQASLVSYLVHHIFLPPQLPRADDFQPKFERVLLDKVLGSLSEFRIHVPDQQHGAIDSAVDMMRNLQHVHQISGDVATVGEENLRQALADLCKQGGSIPLHIRAQNAGVLLTKVDQSIHIEAFELSPRNGDVITTKGRLRRSFPASAVSVDISNFQKADFQAVLTFTLAKMSHQPAVDTQPKAKKAQKMHGENRDTTHPMMITELLTAFLMAVGGPVDVSTIWKNTREEVFWRDSLLPWRRSPMWLLIRVALQLTFYRSTTHPEPTGDLYKGFMVFLMAEVLMQSHDQVLPSDLLSAMNFKVSRRLRKLDSTISESALAFVHRAMRRTNAILEERWSTIQKGQSPSQELSLLGDLAFEEDTLAHLPCLDQFIGSMSTRKSNCSSMAFQPTCVLAKFEAGRLPTCPDAIERGYVEYNLAALETWVATRLGEWLVSHLGDASTCGELRSLIESYHAKALPLCSGNPEATSLMVLTILELWAACDASAIQACQLLEDYSPGIPQRLLQSLVLPFREQLERIHRLEEYLVGRSERSTFPAPHIFTAFGHQDCFPVRYFEQSPKHRSLIAEIEEQAAVERKDKLRELHQKQDEYSSLMSLYEQCQCQYDEIFDEENGSYEKRHRRGCQKCQYRSRANSLDITIHEWPLPADPLQAKSTVFELQLPHWFGHWRDATTFLLVEVLDMPYQLIKRPRASYRPQRCQSISSFFLPFRSAQRIGLLSENKPHNVTHRRLKSISIATEDEVCLDNGLYYRYYDDCKGCFVDQCKPTDTIAKCCGYRLPGRSSSLQQFLFRPAAEPSGPSPNTVISTQSSCPDNMSRDEYKALYSIPIGYRIQWMNILLQLYAPSVDFKKAETELTILQCIQQTGPRQSGTVIRAGHIVVDDARFAHTLLDGLEEASQRFKENWQCSRAFSTFISLATRVLSLTSANDIKVRCLGYLATARNITLGWVNLLRDKAQQATEDDLRNALRSKAVVIALICAGSFNVETEYLNDILASTEHGSIAIQCSIVIQEGAQAVLDSPDPLTRLLYWRWQRYSYRSHLLMARNIVQTKSEALDDAIQKSWSAYEGQGSWQILSEVHDYWMVSLTAHQGDENSFWVHFNLMTGELLVNGVPLDRLPDEYACHPLYHTLFGHSTVEVMPTAVSGLRFSGKKDYAGHTLHFGIFHNASGSSGADFLVRATNGHRTFELVPPRVLHKKFPTIFVEKFVHWYDVNNDCLEFCPKEDPWAHSSQNWVLSRVGSVGQWCLKNGGTFLVDVNSTTSRVLAGTLSALEDPLWIHTTFHESTSSVDIDLPRLQLGFCLKSGMSSVESRQFRGMSVHENQEIGTLVGLRNMLVLKDTERQSHRMVVLPEGKASFRRADADNHVCVTIAKESVTRVHAYHVDNLLGRLVDNGSLQSKLFLCYLHALTSFCLPDPLLQSTGTEQALSILNSASVRSFDELTEENIAMLHRIAHLTPGRYCYPANKRVMQVVDWSPHLGFLAQHGGFYEGVNIIFAQARRSKFFYAKSYVKPPVLDHVDNDLLHRDNIRSSTFRISCFGAENHSVQHDVTYSARDRGQNSSRGSRAFLISSTIFHERSTPHFEVPPDLTSHLWRFLLFSHESFGPGNQLSSSKLTYDAQLLLDSSRSIFKYWSTLHQIISRESPRFDKFKLMIWLSTLAFAKEPDMPVIQTLALIFTVREMAQIHAPSIHSLILSEGTEVDVSELSTIIESASLPFISCPEADLAPSSGESRREFKRRIKQEFQSNKKRAVKALVKALGTGWPCERPELPADTGSVPWTNYIDMDKAMEEARLRFESWFRNYRFREYLRQISDTLPRRVLPLETRPLLAITERSLSRKPGIISVDDVFAHSPPTVSFSNSKSLTWLLSSVNDGDKPTTRLATLVARLDAKAESVYEKKYVKDLDSSLRSLQDRIEGCRCLRPLGTSLEDVLVQYMEYCYEQVRGLYLAMLEAIQGIRGFETLPDIQQWPRLSPIFFLQCLSRRRWQKLSSGWKECIVCYGIALTRLQQAERLWSLSDSHTDLTNELRNPGHTNWDPRDHPESLLLEIESGIMIREVQEQIAAQMRSSFSSSNVVMQLNMGEGKSSVIVPIVAASLADGSRLVRVIVAKPQAKQMFQMLIAKLGGLLDRQVFHMPFSRAVRPGEAEAEAIHRIHQECMFAGGVLLVQPEHILSLKLMGLECNIMGKEAIGQSLWRSQEFLNTSSRDIVDESDENFSVKFELVYTIGMQRPIDHSPERWVIIQQVLEVFKTSIAIVQKELPLSTEIGSGCPGCFPRTRILRQDARERILARVAKQICETGLKGFPIVRQPEPVRQAVYRYITAPKLTTAEIEHVEKQEPHGFWAETTSNTLLLLRGLIAGGVLAFAFSQKRWRVDYGLDLNREPATRLAVPYGAKDNPNSRSEFSHPDVVIILTSLSHYYRGLDNDDLFLTFDHLLKSDQADLEYQLWVKDADGLPFTFKQLGGINLEDRFQCIEQIFPSLRCAKAAIDYFLAHIVFPKEMKEFPHKLSASGWDIGEVKTHPTTGFSGTNDSRNALPTTVEQLDLPDQKHTNALVLAYLLQPENSVALLPPSRQNNSSDAERLLAMVVKMKPPVRVILDVGAQILELDNIGVAREWLKMFPDLERTQAVVFFDNSDQICVLDREGHVEPLHTSPFAGQLDVCLVFLDEAHTRGTDLKLPMDSRAAVTLGANLTKDRLIQACMRMRKLGKGQSVVFCVPEEIETRIKGQKSEPGKSEVNVSDVLVWAVSETWLDARRSMPLWAAQGQRYLHHSKLLNAARYDGKICMTQSQAEDFLEDEAQTLEVRYRPRPTTATSCLVKGVESGDIDQITQRCREFNNLELMTATLREEQERELSPEVEQERQLQKPPAAEPAAHYIHQDIVKFVLTGMIFDGSQAYMPAFESLSDTSAAAHFDVAKFPRGLLVTADFARTIQPFGPSYVSDLYQRSVQWILTSHHSASADGVDFMMIISPYEAQELLPRITQSNAVVLNLYAPRPNLGFRALDTLDLYTVPEQPKARVAGPLTIELNLFAGQLYFKSFEEYIETCNFLDLAWQKFDATCIDFDGLSIRDDTTRASTRFTLEGSLVKFLKVLMMKIRRNCEGIDKTHVGCMLDDRLLHESDFRSLGNFPIDS